MSRSRCLAFICSVSAVLLAPGQTGCSDGGGSKGNEDGGAPASDDDSDDEGGAGAGNSDDDSSDDDSSDDDSSDDDSSDDDSSDDDSTECVTGDETCPCYPNDTCNGSLSCMSGLCVDAGYRETGGSGNGTGGTSPSAGGTENPGTSGTGGTNTGGADPTDTGGSTGTPGTAPEGSPVAVHGRLSVSGTHMMDEHGSVVQLKGVSSMWLNWDVVGYAQNKEGMRWMRDHWGMTVFRAAMGAALPPDSTATEDDTYSGNPTEAEAKVRQIVDNAIELGVYVIIDWHDHEAETRRTLAQGFFEEMARDYGAYPNVIYEVYNEPLDISWSSTLRSYHEAVVGSIRTEDPDNIVILGTPNWSQDVDIAAGDPVSGTNLMYTLHFYACTHGAELMAKAADAYSAGLPIFVTEWGAADADGGVDGVVCESEAATWLDWLDARSIGWAAWKLDGCSDSTCFFKDQTAPPDGNWTSDDLNGHAEFVISRMLTGGGEDPPPASDCTPTGSCALGDGMDCVDGEPAPRDCSGCDLLSCGIACCDSVGHFGAVTYPDYATDMDLVTGFSQSSAEVAVSGAFTSSNQMVAIAFALSSARSIDPYSIAIYMDAAATSDATITVSLEANSGSDGCLYEVYSTGTVYQPYYQVTCWGDFDYSSAVEQINVRLESYAPGEGSLIVTGVDL